MYALSRPHTLLPRNVVSVTLVAGIHIAVIYTLLVALEIVPNPVALPPQIVARLIDQVIS